jgi:hypothetical protein
MRQSIATQVIRESQNSEVDTESTATDRLLARQESRLLDNIRSAAEEGNAAVVLDVAQDLRAVVQERRQLAAA